MKKQSYPILHIMTLFTLIISQMPAHTASAAPTDAPIKETDAQVSSAVPLPEQASAPDEIADLESILAPFLG